MAIGFDLDDKALRRSDKSHRLIDLGQSGFGIDRPLRHAPADAFHLCVVNPPGKRIEHKLYRAASLDILQGVLAKVGVDPDVGGIDQGQSGLTGVNLTAVDGLIIQSTLVNTKRLVPCLSAALKPQVRIGGVICPVSYAGWVPDSIAGLYQVNVTLPGTTGTFYPDWPALTNPITDITGWTVLPVEVKSYDNVLSQTGVTIVVAPR